MASARFKVEFAGPQVSFQDSGRPGQMRFGVPSSGPMDRFSHAAANAALGYAITNTAIEVSLGGIVLKCVSGMVTLAVVGGNFNIEHEGQKIARWSVITIRENETLSIKPGAWGSWCYLAFAGTLNVPTWLGKTATYSMANFGGGMLISGQEIEVQNAGVIRQRQGPLTALSRSKPNQNIRIVMGPQDRHFEPNSIQAFMDFEYALTNASDRMGMRLNGPQLSLRAALSIPSEPIVRGSIQVSGDGVATVLLADHQTTGGYPKIATVISADLDDFVQLRAPAKIRFIAVTPHEAIEAARARKELVSRTIINLQQQKKSSLSEVMDRH